MMTEEDFWFEPVQGTGYDIMVKDLHYALHGTKDLWLVVEHLAEMFMGNPIYRVVVHDRGFIDVSTFGAVASPTIDQDVVGRYKSSDFLPEWMREKLAVLSLLSTEPNTPEIPGVGRRIHPRIFWVYPS